MNRSQGINRLQLDNKRAINQEIKTCLPYGLSLVLNRDRNLTHKRHTAQRQFHRQCFFIYRLKVARAQMPMNLDRCIYRCARRPIEFFFRLCSGLIRILDIHFYLASWRLGGLFNMSLIASMTLSTGMVVRHSLTLPLPQPSRPQGRQE